MGGTWITRDLLPDGDWQEFRKTGTTRMLRMDGPFTVQTREGPLSCPDGWLAVDRAGWPYPIAADEQAVTYEEVVSDAPTAEDQWVADMRLVSPVLLTVGTAVTVGDPGLLITIITTVSPQRGT